MIFWIYRFGVKIILAALPLASLFSKKVRIFIESRKIEEAYFFSKKFPKKLQWFHCSSLGEYEQAKPLIQYFIKNNEFCLVTFFSPSGYVNMKPKENENLYFSYLPLENKRSIKKFLDHVDPKNIFWIKSELWIITLKSIFNRKIPVFMVSARFYEGHYLSKNWAQPWRSALTQFTQIFVQDKFSSAFLQTLNINSNFAGDLRFDNVLRSSQEIQNKEWWSNWIGESKVVIAGSSWKQEEDLVLKFMSHNPGWKLILAPHDVSFSNIMRLEEQLKASQQTFCKWSNVDNLQNQNVFIIDNIGMLSTLYQLANIALVGGGFTGQLHNILEPLSSNVPVVCGPKIDKFWEAQQAEKEGVLYTVQDWSELSQLKDQLLTIDHAKDFIVSNSGSMERVLNTIKAT